MNRSVLKVLVVALLAVGAMIAVAGTVEDLQAGGGTVDGVSETEEPQETQTTAPQTTATATRGESTTEVEPALKQDCVEELRHPLAVLVILTGWVGIVYGVYRRNGAVEASAAFMLVFVVVFMTYPAIAICGPEDTERRQDAGGDEPALANASNESPGVGDGTGDGEGDSRTVPELPLALLAIVAILAAALVGGVLVNRESDDDVDPFESDAAALVDDEADVDVEAFGDVAGRAADRIERTDELDNEIYRAWVEMTGHLDVEHPASSTPGEFADAAIAAGVAPDDVAELTELFERVRYGHDDPTTERERRAIDALRRIESQYGSEAS